MKKNLSKKDQIIVGIALNLLLCLMYYIVFYSSSIHSQKKMKKKLKKVQNEFKQYKNYYNNDRVNSLKNELSSLKEQSKDLFKKVIKNSEILSLIKKISIIASNNNVKISFTSINQGTPMNIYDENKKIMMKKLPINVGIECHIKELIKYLSLIENMKEYLVIDYLNINLMKKDFIRCKLTLVAYIEVI